MAPIASPSVTTTYTVAVTYVNGCTRYDSVTVEVEAGCTDPAPIWTSHITVSSARLNWTSVAEAQIYKIRGRLTGSPNWVNIVAPVSPPFLNVNNLNTAATYEWQIQSVCDIANNDTSPWTALDSFTTGCLPIDSHWTALVAVNGARLSWTQSPGVSAYEIRGRNAASVNWVSIIVGSATTSKDVFGLQPATTYEWTVRKWCDTAGVKKSPYRPLIQFTTLTAGRLGSVDQPQGFSFEKGANVEVYPNPASGQVHLALTNVANQEAVEVRLMDINGKTVKTWQLAAINPDMDYSLSLEGLAAGVYQLSVQSSEMMETRKIVVGR